MSNELQTNQAAPQSPGREFRTSIIKSQDQYLGMIEDQFLKHRIVFTEYKKTCVLNALTSINEVLKKAGISFSAPDLDQSSLSGILQTVAALNLNAGAEPREVYFQLRNEKQGDKFVKKIEMGIEGNGNDALLRNFGVNVDKVSNPWLVREEDDFEYPSYDGFDMTPPKWTPKGVGKFVRIVYAIRLKDGSAEYLIQEREDVKANLMAHISNNLMNVTFGICAKRFGATAEQLAQIDAKKKAITDLAKSLSLEDALDCEELSKWISPAWTEPQSREQMIIRKMRNNAVKKYPKDFGSMFASSAYSQMDDTYDGVIKDVTEQTTQELIDTDGEAKTIPETSSAPIKDVTPPLAADPKKSKPAAPITPPKIHPQPTAPDIDTDNESEADRTVERDLENYIAGPGGFDDLEEPNF